MVHCHLSTSIKSKQPAKWEFGGQLFLSERGTLVPHRLSFSGLKSRAPIDF